MAREDITVLGINDGHTAGAALVRNGRVLAAIQEERLSNVKNAGGVPRLSVREVYRIARVNPSETDAIAIVSLNRVYAPLSEEPLKVKFFEAISPIIHSHIWSKYYVKILHKFRRMDDLNAVLLDLGIADKEVLFTEHHQAHMASAYYQRPWEEDTLILTNDGAGDGLSSTVSVGRRFEIERLASSTYYDSVGNTLYSEITGYLGMKRWEHEYKVMGLAPYGQSKHCIESIRSVIRLNPKKPLEFQNRSHRCGTRIQPKLSAKLAGHRFDNIAAATQEHFEDLMIEWVRNAVRISGLSRVVCGGGLFLNVKANKRIRELPEVERVFFHPACDDGGTPVGAALQVYVDLCKRDGKKPFVEPLGDLYYGSEYSNDDVEDIFKTVGLSKKPEYIADIEGHLAEMIAKGKIVARFTGRMEWGPRALGNRSIVADPRDPKVIRRLNKAIKMRDFWMPFAPSTLEADSERYFENFRPARYMIEAFDTRPESEEIIAGLHPQDGTARPHSVNEWNREYLRLLEAFKSLTSVSGVLNTSFNLHGFPIVGTPEVALNTLRNSALDAVAMGNWLVERCCL